MVDDTRGQENSNATPGTENVTIPEMSEMHKSNAESCLEDASTGSNHLCFLSCSADKRHLSVTNGNFVPS